MSFCLIGCQKAKTEFKNVNNICELTNIIENNDEVIVEISKNTCPGSFFIPQCLYSNATELMFSFESITPFGTPVVPPVLSITATASFSKATFSAFVPLPCFMKSCHFKYLPLSGSGRAAAQSQCVSHHSFRRPAAADRHCPGPLR